MRMLVAVLACAAILAMPRASDACSCGFEPAVMSPRDGATGVPVNAIVIAQHQYAYEPTIEVRNATTQEIVEVTQHVRHSRTSLFGSTVFATPTALFAPNTTYIASTRASPEASVTTTTFATGDAIDMTPPAFDGLTGMTMETMTYPIFNDDGSSCISSCINFSPGHISRIDLAFATPPADVVLLVFELYSVDDILLEETPLAGPQTHLGFQQCRPLAPSLEPGADYCARLVAYDSAGNRAGSSARACGTAAICAPLGKGGRNCEPSDECRPPPDPEPESSGCSSTPAPSAALLWFLFLVIARRK